MIKRLRIRFVALSMLSLLVVLVVIMAGMHVVNYRNTVGRMDALLLFLAEHDGQFPEMQKPGDEGGPPPEWSPELPFETRYFYTLMDENGKVIRTETKNIAAVDREMAEEYSYAAVELGKEHGFVGKYRFILQDRGERSWIIFVDCGRILESFWGNVFTGIGISMLGYVLVFLLILFLSPRIIRPIAESYEKQKRFITDAGHELKTPLTIIRADVDVLEMDFGKNEWLEDIQKQTMRLTDLTNELVQLARLEESESAVRRIEFPVSDVVEEEVSSFQRLAHMQNKVFTSQIQSMITLKGDEKAIRQMVTVLLDNALKYSEETGQISVTLEQQNKTLRLEVFNTTAERVDRDRLPNFFDRFYRGDPSRNSQSGGYGIGLSVAKAVVDAHNGKIAASTQDEQSLRITVNLPL